MEDFQHAGLTCRVILTGMGHHCGYVAVPTGHPWHGQNYRDSVKVSREVLERPISADNVGAVTLLCAAHKADLEASTIPIELALDVHGGVTFSGQHKDRPLDLWWFGFDCAHCDDGRAEGLPGWKDAAFTEAQCRRLAEQLAAVATP